MKISIAYLGLALTVSSSVSVAGVEYQDTNLHRSDDLVRFDRAYRAGLQDGTTTIIYSDAKAPGAVPDQPKSVRRSHASASGSEPESSGRYSARDRSENEDYMADAREYESSLPEKMQDDRYAEKRRYPTDQQERSSYPRSASDECDCDDVGKRRAPRSEPVEPSVAAEPQGEATMREKLEAVRKARELLRKSRQNEVAGDPMEHSEPASTDAAKYGSDTPRLIDHGKEVTAEVAPLTPYELDPDFVRNQEVSVEFNAATIEEIATHLMPRGWRVRLSTSDQEAHQAQYEFVSSDAREVALRKLLYGTGLGYKMFFNLKDDHGNPSPLLVISEVKS